MANDIDLVRLNLNFPSDLLKKVEKYAEDKHVTKTVAFTLLVQDGLRMNEIVQSNLSQLVSTCQ